MTLLNTGCVVTREKLDLIPSKMGSGSLNLEFKPTIKSPEIIFDSYIELKYPFRIQAIQINKIPAGSHSVQVYSKSWDTTVFFTIKPSEYNQIQVATP